LNGGVGVIGVIIILITYIFIGAFDGVRGIQTSRIGTEYGLELSQMGVILAAVPIGFLFSGPIMGRMADRFGAKRSLVCTTLLFITSLLGLIFSNSFSFLVVSFFIAGLSKGGMEISLNYLTTSLHATNKGRSLGLVHAGYGMGAFIFPMITGTLFLAGWSWVSVFTIMVIFFMISFSMLPFLKLKRVEQQSNDHSALPDQRSSKYLIALVCATFFYVGAEVGLLSWLPYYFEHMRHIETFQIPYYIGAFFVLLMIGRLVGGFIVDRVGYERSILVTSIVATACLMIGPFVPNTALWIYSIVGIFFSIIFPTFIAMASKYFSGSVGTVIGYLTTAAGAGAAVSSWLIGYVANHISFAVAFSIPSLLMVFLILIMMWFSKKGGSPLAAQSQHA